ncbi:MAG: hypothetical protein HYT36_03590, partial [Candidatus Staskawiczbacteria bacterium]|nr:hypothetical protein [Candidatus Staskawiczbacteria bacterium]
MKNYYKKLNSKISKFIPLAVVMLFAFTALFASSITFGQTTNYSATVSSATVPIKTGTLFSVSWTAPTGENLTQDWIGIYTLGASNTAPVKWAYTNSQMSGSVDFSLDNPGTYEARYLKNNGYNSVATSSQFTVEAGTGTGSYVLTVPTAPVKTGES